MCSSDLFWGVPTGTIGGMVGQYLPDEGPIRDIGLRGLEEYTLNKVMTLASGEEVGIDFSTLAPGDLHGMAQLTYQMFTTDLGTIVASSPAGSLLFGGNPRLTNWAKTTARFTNLIDDYSTPTEFSEVAHSAAKIASGYTNMYKSLYMLAFERKLNSGETKVVDPDVNTVEGVAQAFGLGTKTERDRREFSIELYEKRKTYMADVDMWLADFSTALSNRDLTSEQTRETVKTFSELHRVFNQSPEAMKYLRGKLERDAKSGVNTMYSAALKALDFLPDGEWENTMRNSGMPEENVKTLLQVKEDLKKYRNEEQ